MSKLDDLRNYVADLFDNATEKDTIEKAAIVNNKIDEIMEEQKTSEENYNKLLKDYKDVILHSNFKPQQGETSAYEPIQAFNPEQAFEDALKSSMVQK